jgi:hypothetical protein
MSKKKQQNEDKSERIKRVKFTKDLICNLKPEEVAAYADDLAQLIDRGASTEAEFDGVKKAWKGKIDDIKREVMATSTKVREHKELRLVKCVRELDFGAGEVREVRTDTGEILGTRPISDTERQKELDFDGDVTDEFDDEAADSKDKDDAAE